MTRNDGESYISYAKRLTNAVEDGLIEYDEYGDNLLGLENNYNSENIRKFYYIFKKWISKIDDEIEFSDESFRKEIEMMKYELQKERYRTQDQKRELNKICREDARFDQLLEVLQKKVEAFDGVDFKPKRIIGEDIIEASLILSDLHVDLKVDNVLNFYDINTAKERMEELCGKIIDKCMIHNVSKLNIELCGDLINGIINMSNRCEQEEDSISSILTTSDIISNFIKNIMKNEIEVVVYAVIGNHSRIEKDKKASLGRENFERLIFEYIKLKIPSLRLIQNGYEDFITYKIKDREIVVTHGDKDTIANAKIHFLNILNRKVDEIHFGHIHHFNVKDDNGTTIVTNGSLIGLDNYALSLRCNSKPSQVLRVYDNDVCTYNLELS